MAQGRAGEVAAVDGPRKHPLAGDCGMSCVRIVLVPQRGAADRYSVPELRVPVAPLTACPPSPACCPPGEHKVWVREADYLFAKRKVRELVVPSAHGDPDPGTEARPS